MSLSPEADDRDWEGKEEEAMIMNALLKKLKTRNRVERDPFQTFSHCYTTMLQKNQQLKQQVTNLKRQISLFETLSEGDPSEETNETTTKRASSNATRVFADSSPEAMQRKLKELQSEIQAVYKQQEQTSKEKTEIAHERDQLRHTLRTMESELSQKKAKIETLEEDYRLSQQKLKESTEMCDTLRNEILSERKARERAEGENETLRQTTEQLENRILDEKLKSVEELNKMNAANENLRQQLDKSIGNKAQKSRGASSSSAGGLGDFVVDEDYIDLGFMSSSKDKGEKSKRMEAEIPQSNVAKVKGHSSDINRIKFSPASSVLATASSDGKVKLWDSNSLKHQVTYRGSGNTGAAIGLDMMGNSVASSFNDNCIHVWDVSSAKHQHTLTGHASKAYSIKFPQHSSGMILVSGSNDRSIKVWDLSSGGCCQRTIATKSSINCIDVSQDGSIVITGHQDCSVALWDVGTGTKLGTNSTQHRSAVVHVSFIQSSGDGLVLTMGRDNTLSILDAGTLEKPKAFESAKDTQSSPSPAFRHSSFRLGLNWCQAASSPFGSDAICPGKAARRSGLPAYITAGSTDGNMYVWQPSLALPNAKRNEDDEVFVRPKYDVACILTQKGDKVFDFSDKKKIQGASRAFAQYMNQQARNKEEERAPAINCVDWAQNNNAVAMGSSSGVVTLWTN